MKLTPPRIAIGDSALFGAIAVLACAGLACLGLQSREILASTRQAVEHERRIYDLQLTHYRLDLARRTTVFDFAQGPNPDVVTAYRDIASQQGRSLAQMRSSVVLEETAAAIDAAMQAFEQTLDLESTALNFALNANPEGVGQTLVAAQYYGSIAAMYDALHRANSISWREVADATATAESSFRALYLQAAGLAAALIALALIALGRAIARKEAASRALVERDAMAAKLAHRERETNANLVSRNPLPAIEFEFPPAAKLVAWLRSRGIENLERWLSLYPGEIRKLAPQFSVGHVSASAASLLGAQDATQLRDIDRWLPDRALHQCALAMLRSVWTKDPAVDIEVDVRAFDGQARRLEIKGRLVATKKGKPPALIASLIDVTDTHRIEEEVETLRTTLAETSLAQNAFITSVNRDLRAPLDGVTGMANALQRTRLDHEQSAMLEVIVEAGESMRDTVNRALDFSKLEAGEFELAEKPFDVGAMIETVRTRFEPQARAKNLPLRVIVDADADRRLVGDQSRIRQILSKLISNAINFTPNGEVEARISLAPHSDEGELLVLTVRDTGPGLSAEELSDALDDAAAKRGGLSLCRRLCEAMGGALEVKSSTDYGTTVTARIRTRAAGERGVVRPAASTKANPDRKLRLLAADDNAINRMVIKDMLEPRGMDLTLVENGADAIAAWRSQQFDAVLLDLQMPLLSGYDVAREIRKVEAEERRGRTPLIAVTASVMRSEIDTCLEAGMDAHVAKPIDPEELISAIRELTSGGGEESVNAAAASRSNGTGQTQVA